MRFVLLGLMRLSECFKVGLISLCYVGSVSSPGCMSTDELIVEML